MQQKLTHIVAGKLRGAEQTLAATRVLVGLDGFVDTILHVVDKRESATEYVRLNDMRRFAQRVEAAAGLSANFEFVTQVVKLGGNGPIMANALDNLGTSVTYIGNLGRPNLHPVFADFAERAEVHSIAEPGYTDAVEFDDGKLMFGKHASLGEINWQNILRALPEQKLQEKISDCSLIAIVNWTMLPFMNQILRKILSQIGPGLSGTRRWAFFDLADPAKRTRENIVEVLDLIGRFEKHFRVILGLNLQESRQVGEVLGIKPPEETYGTVTDHAARLRERLKLDTVVVHPTSFAAAADETGATHVVGPFTAKPKIATGAGDHFNAGFCIGRLLGGDIASSLQVGVTTSGFYVRNAHSPSLSDLKRFLKTI